MKAALATLALATLGALTLAALLQSLRAWLAARTAGLASERRYEAQRTRLTDERDRLLNHLREIRFDRETGKLDAADYERLAARYTSEAAAVLDALAALESAGRAEAGTVAGALPPGAAP